MKNVARLPESDRRELFRNTSDKMGLNDAIVEKDFWVCFTLDYLFHRCPWKDAITFQRRYQPFQGIQPNQPLFRRY